MDDRFGLWKQLDRAGRVGWLRSSFAKAFANPSRGRLPDAPSKRLVLDATGIVDAEGFFCAMGEAVNGPGGYFGQHLLGFSDCVVGGFGIDPPWELRIVGTEELRRVLGREESIRHAIADIEDAARVPGAHEELILDSARRVAGIANGSVALLFDDIVDTLRERRVAVVCD